jgi:hypothetical protein
MDEYYDNIMKGRPWDEKVGIWLRKHNADKFDEKATEFMRPIVQGIVLFNPLVGVVNDVKTLFVGEDIYKNKACGFDRGVAAVSLATFGAARSAKEPLKKIFNRASLWFSGYSALGVSKSNINKK